MNLKSCLVLLPSLLCGATLHAQTAPAAAAESQLLTAEGRVQVLPVGAANWESGTTNLPLHIGDRLRTGPRSRATIRLSDLTVLRVNELTTLQISAPQQAGKQSLLDVKAGSTYFFSREKPAQQEFRTPLTSGAIRGTEFNLAVAADGRTEVTLIDGAVTLSNQLGQLEMASGDGGLVEPGKPPVKTAMLEANNIIQWCLYYPGVLDAGELEFTTGERNALADSLTAYNNGDLLQAVALYPGDRTPGSDSERVYRAATLLSAGQSDQAEAMLAGIANNSSDNRPTILAAALREVIAVVKNQPGPRAASPRLATEWLAESYYHQSHGQLAEALKAAQSAVKQSPDFGFGWARVAEMELSFGHRTASLDALDKSLRASPRNAQSLAVKGFILLTQGKVAPAQSSFEEAIALDGALGNAWLGRGLCKIRRGDDKGGMKDLQVAAVLEPQRSILRSYLGKAFSNEGDNVRARKELGLAQHFDPNDPTSWLYAALVNQEDNRINDGVNDLEKSEQLNDNERLFRSRLLLDEDQSVRSANLARIYQDDGMFDWSLREASRAVNLDYANYSAHQFLANSYDVLRDPNEINLRYETPWFGELLVSELLAPVSAGNLSEFVSEDAHARMFEGNYVGASSLTEYTSHGDWRERGSQFGTYDTVSYALDAEYISHRGWRPNNDLWSFTGSMKGKDQITANDSIFLEGQYFQSAGGDTVQYYNQYSNIAGQPAPSGSIRVSERAEPNIFLGWHHEWGPGLHTLFLAGRLNDTFKENNPLGVVPFIDNNFTNGMPILLEAAPESDPNLVDFSRQSVLYSMELQQIWETEHQTLVAGARYQYGIDHTSSYLTDPTLLMGGVSILNAQETLETHVQRYSLYAYETVKPCDQLQITAGFSYDRLRFPRDIDTPPITSDEAQTDQLSPKAGILWSPFDHTHLRAAYTRSMNGASDDASVRLEPVQVAGFTQAYRSVAPESIAGQMPGTRFTTYGVGLDQSFASKTYLSIDGEILESRAQRSIGVTTNGNIADSGNTFLIRFGLPPSPNQDHGDSPSTTRQNIGYREETLTISVNQLLGRDWSVGARYQLSHSALATVFEEIPASVVGPSHIAGRLQQVQLYANYNLPCGFFSQAQAIWMGQKNLGDQEGLAGANFWQFNAFAGYRFLHREAEVKIGVLNIGNQDYLLSPINLYNDLPRNRTFAASLLFYF